MSTVGEQFVLVIDDDAPVRESILGAVRSEGLAARGFTSGEDFFASLDLAGAGCVITDLRLPGMSGLELLRKLRASHAVIPVIVVTGSADVRSAVRAMKAGAADFLEKPVDPRELMAAVRAAVQSTIEKQATQSLAENTRQKIAALSEDEQRVYRLLMAGEQNKQIAATLGIGLRTVELRRAMLLKKMAASSLPELVRLAILGGLSSEPPS